MLKFTKDDKTCQQQLEEALNTMLEVLRIVNNSMYQVSITGYTVKTVVLSSCRGYAWLSGKVFDP